MDNILKQRLIGALILLALGVVFWPIIFVEPQGPGGLPGARIPPPPLVDTTPIEPPDTAGLREAPQVAAQRDARAEEAAAIAEMEASTTEPEPEQNPEPDVAPVPAEETVSEASLQAEAEVARATRKAAPVAPKLDAQGVPEAWILQVVSVSNKTRAESIRDGLIADGHKAYVKPIKSADRTLYRVYIGPKFERAQLERIQGQVNSQLGVKSMVARYVP
ncbi:MAG: SPOR domain-containing protein [Halieaceae bacterium]